MHVIEPNVPYTLLDQNSTATSIISQRPNLHVATCSTAVHVLVRVPSVPNTNAFAVGAYNYGRRIQMPISIDAAMVQVRLLTNAENDDRDTKLV